MQKLAHVCIRRPVFASMLILALVVAGTASYVKLGVDRYPSIDLPTVRISTRLPGASPAEVEAQVTQPIEEVVNTVQGIKELRSISGAGNSFVSVTFELHRDIDIAAQDVRDRVATVLRDLPREADPPVVAKFDNDLSPIMTVAVAGDRSLRELTEIADKIVKVQLERSEGVGEVDVVGGLERAINVWVDADRLAAYQIPITMVREAIVRQNANIPGGNVTGALREETLRTQGRIIHPADFNDLVVAHVNGKPICVRDIGRAEDGTKEQRSVARLNGTPTVTLEIRRQSGANTVAVIEGIKEKLAGVQAQLPPDVRLEILRDQSRYIYEALHEINRHLILGSILASIVVLAFMRNIRATFIAAIAIPTSVISTFGMMWALNFTLNSVTMLALVLMVGIVIDDAIVVLENIFRHVEEKKMNPFEAAHSATQEIALAVMATTLSLVVIFVPVSFMSSISGRFLFQFGLTAAVAVLVSLLVSFTLTPMMSARLLHVGGEGEASGHSARSRRGFYGYLDRAYARLLGYSIRHRGGVVVVALLVVLTSVPLYKLVRQEYIPSNVDEGEFEMSITAREGTSLPAMIQAALAVEKEVRAIPGVRLILTSIGGGGLLGNVNNARFYIQLAPHQERTFSWMRLINLNPLSAFKGNYSQRDVMQEVRRRLKKFPDLRLSVRNLQSFSLGGSPAEVDFAILGPDLETLLGYAEQLRRRAPELGLVDADTTLKLDKPELRVDINRDRAARLGVETADIANALRIMVGGDDRVSKFRDPSVNDDYDVQLRLSETDRNDAEDILSLYIPRQGGGLVRLDNVVDVTHTQTASRIDRLDRQRLVSLRASVAPEFALADRLEALRGAVAEMKMPQTYTTRVAGRGRELETTFREFLWAFLLSVIFMYLILASQFESLVHPLTILLSLPLSVPFALLSLWATGNTINLYSALGMLVLFGVVKKNAILQIDLMNQLRAKGMPRFDAIMQANRDRLRPILMTTLALVAGMLPLALGTGPGAEERRGIAIIVIGGQTLSLLLTLLVTPVAYSLFDDLAERLSWNRLAAKLPLPAASTHPSEPTAAGP
ncbi:MAG: efflux RND transporter permease subunit [Verrucomicrobiota bacterium]